MHAFIHSFIYLFIYSIIHSNIHSYIHSGAFAGLPVGAGGATASPSSPQTQDPHQKQETAPLHQQKHC